jgi:hypothetical protein
MLLRPLRVSDVTTVAAVVTADPAAGESVAGRAAAFGWERRARHLLNTDASGAWLAERDGRVLGARAGSCAFAGCLDCRCRTSPRHGSADNGGLVG